MERQAWVYGVHHSFVPIYVGFALPSALVLLLLLNFQKPGVITLLDVNLVDSCTARLSTIDFNTIDSGHLFDNETHSFHINIGLHKLIDVN